ncbi:hypothetical protein BOTBODRAFT_33637 [Botryobasidium botryosum FD-172 SS1]|uniref:Mid2 domain-containing protein n=1 Tax=Botryobasidium botryosum (strain FD-172 SS1) TaxID=930990 RepID=A0A067MN60_BOTB1|nr:hypothetical protein BOTBODRAFT_33637 [Botryobasidium botryosum FD-172 SS1]
MKTLIKLPSRALLFLLLSVDLAWSLIYNVTYEITDTTINPNLTVTWFPPDAWTGDLNGYNNGGSARQTDVSGATMNFTFNGRAVYVIGVKAPTSSLFAVTIDNGAPQYRNINSDSTNVYVFRQMLFSQDGLDPNKTHSFLANQSSATGSGLALDQIIITKDTDASPPNPDPSPPPTPHHSSSAPIIGGVVGGVVALIAVGVAIYLWLRLRKAKSYEEYAPAPVQQNYGPVDLWEPPANPTHSTPFSYPATESNVNVHLNPMSVSGLSHAPSTAHSYNPTSHAPSESVMSTPWRGNEFIPGSNPARPEKGSPAPPPYTG